MRTISEQELKDILDKHGKWLRNEEGGERANLSYANLSYANLITFQFQRHQAFFTLDGTLRIGCMVMPISEWLLGFEEVGKNEGYNDQQIKAYGAFIKMCAEMLK